MKELQAGMATEMVGTVDARFRAVADQLHKETQSTAEAMLKVAEVLGEKIDRLSVRVDEGVGNDLQIVVDRMTDAIRRCRRPAGAARELTHRVRRLGSEGGLRAAFVVPTEADGRLTALDRPLRLDRHARP